MAAVSGGSALVVQLISLLNKTIHELGFFIRQATPFLMACLEMVNKCIGGFYLLVTILFEDRKCSEKLLIYSQFSISIIHVNVKIRHLILDIRIQRRIPTFGYQFGNILYYTDIKNCL